MVNLNFDKFNRIQKNHKSRYIGGDQSQQQGVNDHKYNDNQHTDKKPGVTGRDIPSGKEF
ncbi:hypothetical protein [Peribacillus glennii]|uniref:Uncharacterized protein n=1 Tax=Peribacillus glennii TaxID=2303991 RepID=A0A372L964_9BACI|nr:hypothetical protein [Peribacillus glennii]RFU62082.1 hypothetical protein D0466_15990 [Peribacillus glennii]